MNALRFRMASLRDEEYFQFMTELKILLEEIGVDEMELNIDPLYRIFLPYWHQLDLLIKSYRKSEYTKKLAEADTIRDNAYRGLVLFVRAYHYSVSGTNIEAAERMQFVIDNYGDFRKKSYNEQTAAVYNLLEDLTERCSAEITQLHAQEWISDLRMVNTLFEQLMNERYDEAAETPIYTMREVRAKLNEVYYNIIRSIEIVISYAENKTVQIEFLTRLNERITYYKNTLSTRKGRSDAQKEKEEEEEEENELTREIEKFIEDIENEE